MEDDDVEKEEDDDVEEENDGDDDGDDEATAQKLGPHFAEPPQSKCTSTCHKGHFLRKFAGKMPQTRS